MTSSQASEAPPASSTSSFDTFLQKHPPAVTITRDFAIIGGGSSGIYTAIRLLDAHKTVAVIEAKDTLGGHTQTYYDAASNKHHDYGVVIYTDSPAVRSFHERLGVPLSKATLSRNTRTVYFDFAKGEVVPYKPADPSAAMGRYAAQLAKYPFLLDGFAGMPDPVPEELLLPLGEFLEKHGAGEVAYFLSRYNQGTGDPRKLTALYMAKSINLNILRGAREGFLASARENNHEVFERAAAELGEDVWLESRVVRMDRSADLVRVLVSTPSGMKLVMAKKLVFAIPPYLENLEGFDLSKEEKDLFSRFRHTGYYTGLLRNSGIPNDTRVTNVGKNTPYDLPLLPGSYSYSPSNIDGLFDVKYGTEDVLSDDEVKGRILAELQQLRQTGVIPDSTDNEPEFVRFSSHTPFALTVSFIQAQHGSRKSRR